jgi:hypothetical protein
MLMSICAQAPVRKNDIILHFRRYRRSGNPQSFTRSREQTIRLAASIISFRLLPHQAYGYVWHDTHSVHCF